MSHNHGGGGSGGEEKEMKMDEAKTMKGMTELKLKGLAPLDREDAFQMMTEKRIAPSKYDQGQKFFCDLTLNFNTGNAWTLVIMIIAGVVLIYGGLYRIGQKALPSYEHLQSGIH